LTGNRPISGPCIRGTLKHAIYDAGSTQKNIRAVTTFGHASVQTRVSVKHDWVSFLPLT